MKLTNQEIIEAIKNIMLFQKKEIDYFSKTGIKMLRGKIKIAYAIEKNKETLRQSLKTYGTVLESLNSEYRDLESEKISVKKEAEAAKKEKREVRDLPVIMQQGKSFDSYMEKISELKSIETDVDVHMVSIDDFDGLDLDSSDLGLLMFMIK